MWDKAEERSVSCGGDEMKTTKTNLGKTKEEIIYELLLSLNAGDNYYVRSTDDRIQLAKHQYERLVDEGVIEELGD